MVTGMFIFLLAIFLTKKLTMADEEVKQEQEQQRKVFNAFTKQLHEHINEQLQTSQGTNFVDFMDFGGLHKICFTKN